jgi:hypothetical protein
MVVRSDDQEGRTLALRASRDLKHAPYNRNGRIEKGADQGWMGAVITRHVLLQPVHTCTRTAMIIG